MHDLVQRLYSLKEALDSTADGLREAHSVEALADRTATLADQVGSLTEIFMSILKEQT